MDSLGACKAAVVIALADGAVVALAGPAVAISFVAGVTVGIVASALVVSVRFRGLMKSLFRRRRHYNGQVIPMM